MSLATFHHYNFYIQKFPLHLFVCLRGIIVSEVVNKMDLDSMVAMRGEYGSIDMQCKCKSSVDNDWELSSFC